MYIGKTWYEECEVQVLVKQLERERDAYKQELTDTLRKAAACVKGEDYDCCLCPYYYQKLERCPSGISQYEAKLRLEELVKEN